MADVSGSGAGQVTLLAPVTEPAVPDADDVLIAEELLVEEISIDGMCGVY